MGAIFVPTRFSLVRISVRDLVADGKSLLRNSGVGGGGEILILNLENAEFRRKPQMIAGNRTEPQEPAENRRLMFCPLRFVPLSAALSAPKSQRSLRFAIAMPIADPRNRAIAETRESNAALRFKGAMESR